MKHLTAPRVRGELGNHESLTIPRCPYASMSNFRVAGSLQLPWLCGPSCTKWEHSHLIPFARDSWTRFDSRSHRTFPRVPPSDPLLVNRSSKHFYDTGIPVFMRDSHGLPGRNHFRLVYVEHDDVHLCETLQVVDVVLVRNSGTPTPVGSHLVEILPESCVISTEEYFVCQCRQDIPPVGCGMIQPGETLGVSATPFIRTPLIIWDW